MGESLFSVNWLVLRLHREHLVRAAQAYARGRLLDIGCGRQPYTALLQEGVSQYISIEIDRQRYASTPPRVWSSGLCLPFRDCSFATVLCAQVLEHVPEPGQLLGEVRRVLQPGGHLILTAPHIWGIHEEPRDYYRFTGYGLEYLACRAGLEPVDIHPLAGYWVTAGARFCHYLQQFEKIGLALVVRPLCALVQVLAWGLDRVHRVESDAWNFLMVARRP